MLNLAVGKHTVSLAGFGSVSTYCSILRGSGSDFHFEAPDPVILHTKTETFNPSQKNNEEEQDQTFLVKINIKHLCSRYKPTICWPKFKILIIKKLVRKEPCT